MGSGLVLPYQASWVKCDDDFAIYIKSRRIGISWAEALWSVRRRLTKKIDHFFISANLQTALEFIRYCRQWADVFSVVLGDEVLDLNGVTTQCLTFPNGSRIVALSSNPTALRGMGGDVTLDEFAFHQFSDELYTAAQPVRQWGGKLRIISTPNGPTTTFQQIVDDHAARGFTRFKTTLLDAVADGLAVRCPGEHKKLLPDVEACNAAFIESIRQTCLSDAQFGQEYMCEVSEASSLITDDQYDSCILSKDPTPTELDHSKKYGPLYIGYDIGRSKNLSVIWVLEEGIDPTAPSHMQRCYRTVAMREMANMPFDAQYEVADKFISHRSVFKACVDAGAIGAQLAETLAGKHGTRVEGVHIGAHTKARLVERVAKMVAQHRVSVPADAETKADLMSMRRMTTKTGNVSYDGNSGTSHCDRYIALSLALEAADSGVRLGVTTNKTNGGT